MKGTADAAKVIAKSLLSTESFAGEICLKSPPCWIAYNRHSSELLRVGEASDH